MPTLLHLLESDLISSNCDWFALFHVKWRKGITLDESPRMSLVCLSEPSVCRWLSADTCPSDWSDDFLRPVSHRAVALPACFYILDHNNGWH